MKWPRCISCGTDDHVIRCEMCNQYTCVACMHIPTNWPEDIHEQDNGCYHEQPTRLATSDGWN